MLQDNHIRIEKLADASFFITDLFQKSFDQAPPTFPLNYVAFYKLDPGMFRAIGYIHMTECSHYGLVGGLCVNIDHRHKGLGEALLRHVEKDVGEKKALFVYTNNPTIANRCGYALTKEKHLMVKWAKRIPQEAQEQIIDEVIKVGPF
jgi:predicted N-acetyltransferase YhbS